MTEEQTTFEGWVILELMGHRRLAGFVREVEVAGHGFLRIDVSGKDGEVQATQLYSPGAIYAITPTTEEVAKSAGRISVVAPVTRWQLEPRPDLVEAAASHLEGADYGDDDMGGHDDDMEF
ncbi:acetyltransferase [Planctomycetota bacterium]